MTLIVNLFSGPGSGGEESPSFALSVKDIFDRFDNLNFFINRTKAYVKHGRSQTIEEAENLDIKIKNTLNKHNIPYLEISGSYQVMTKVILKEIFLRFGVDTEPK